MEWICWGEGRECGAGLKSLLAGAEDSCLQAVAPLLKYLDEKLALLNDSLVKENLSRYQLGGGVGGMVLAHGVTQVLFLQGARGPLGAASTGHSAGVECKPRCLG